MKPFEKTHSPGACSACPKSHPPTPGIEAPADTRAGTRQEVKPLGSPSSAWELWAWLPLPDKSRPLFPGITGTKARWAGSSAPVVFLQGQLPPLALFPSGEAPPCA